MGKREKRYLCDNAQLMAEWDFSRNNGISPHETTCGSHKKVWWHGKCGHEWQAQIHSRSNGRGCPICAGKQIIVGENDLETNYPRIAEEWHPTKNGELTPQNVTYKSNRTVWWICQYGHEWQAKVLTRAYGHTCPFCMGRYVTAGENDLVTKNPHVAEEWHPTKNGSLAPCDVMPGSSNKVWWLGKCGHEWDASIKNRTNLGHGCPQCAREKRKGM